MMEKELSAKNNVGMAAEVAVEAEAAAEKNIEVGTEVKNSVLEKSPAAMEQIRRESCVRTIGNHFQVYGLISLLYGIFYSLCLYKNPNGILVPVFTAVSYGLAFWIIKKMDVKVKRDSYYLVIISVLISIATCRTLSFFFIFFNKTAVLLLWWVFWLHQFYDDRFWNIGKYFSSIFLLLFQTIGMLAYPFKHCADYFKSLKNKKSKTVVLVLLGFLIAIPVMMLLAVLLSEADLVFQNILKSWMDSFLKPWTIIRVVGKTLAGMLMLYCLICELSRRTIKTEVADRRRQEPVVAITVMGLVALMYLMFCGIQIVYLFLGRGMLPDGVTYAEYARQGFFQLVFVAVLNLVLVLLCLKYFKKSRVLNAVLTVISICTYVMIASAGYRMILYVAEYKLTLLRILVLWFLGVLSILMAGVLVIIYRNTFPLFKYCLVVVSVCYLGLTWMKPDLVIARYNISHEAEMGFSELNYLTQLSLDAAPEIVKLKNHPADKYQDVSWYFNQADGDMSWRTYNFSFAKAKKYQNVSADYVNK